MKKPWLFVDPFFAWRVQQTVKNLTLLMKPPALVDGAGCINQ